MATHSSFLAWRIPQTEEPGQLQSNRVAKSQTWLKGHSSCVCRGLALPASPLPPSCVLTTASSPRAGLTEHLFCRKHSEFTGIEKLQPRCQREQELQQLLEKQATAPNQSIGWWFLFLRCRGTRSVPWLLWCLGSLRSDGMKNWATISLASL